jgi:hypothetical protein
MEFFNTICVSKIIRNKTKLTEKFGNQYQQEKHSHNINVTDILVGGFLHFYLKCMAL